MSSVATAAGDKSTVGRQAVGNLDKVVAAVVLERLPVVLPNLPNPVAEFKSFS